MTILASDHFGASPGRDVRVLAFAAEEAATELFDRTVFSGGRLSWADAVGVEYSQFDPARQADRVRAGDIVVLDRAPSAALYAALRERGAHTVWPVGPSEPWPRAERRAEGRAPVDAYVRAWRASGPRGLSVEHLIAVMPAADRVCEKSMLLAASQRPPDGQLAVAWRSLLADVVHDDHDEHVGGVRRARPTVAAR